ncbi:MAG: helix-turn-helix domain-containing protein [Pseudonocardiaceae bacterium]
MAGVHTLTMGRRLRQIRLAQHKSLRTVAGLAGISPRFLSELESGTRALDRHSLMVALTDAVGTSPVELMTLPVPAPANGGVDMGIEAVRQSLLAVGLHHHAGGQVVPAQALRARCAALVQAHRSAERPGEVGAMLAVLIRDLHTSIAAGREVAELLEVAVLVHTQLTLGWLRVAGAPLDLRAQAATLARHTAQDLGTATALGLAAWGGLSLMISAGIFDLARDELDEVSVPPTSPESTQLAGMLALCRALLATVDSRPVDAVAPLEQAVELAERTGEGDAYGMGFGPTTVGLWQMYGLLDVGDHAQAMRVGAGLHPQAHLPPLGQAGYWVTYGRALARVRGHRDDAIAALGRAEQISPARLYRDPFATDVLAELVARSRDDAVGRELRGMAHRSALPR